MELGSQWRARSSTIPSRNERGPNANSSFASTAHSVEEIYDDIKGTLRVSVINLPFSLWSNQPPLLEFFWTRLKPNLATRYVEAAADRIRERAVRAISARFRLPDLERLEGSDLSTLTNQLGRYLVDIHLYANPKLLIATAGLLEALHGHPFAPVKDRALRMRVTQGIPAAMPKVAMQEEPLAKPRDSAVLKEIQEMLALPVVSSDYLYLSSLDGCLDRTWLELKHIIKIETYGQLAADLESLAALLARGLPYPVAVGREALKSIGLTVSEARNWIMPSHMALTRLVLNMAALKVALDGKEAALQSPYPISTKC